VKKTIHRRDADAGSKKHYANAKAKTKTQGDDADDGAMMKTQTKSRGDDRHVFLRMVMMTRLTSLTWQETLEKTPPQNKIDGWV
jgi:hypothetical protein